VKQIQAIPSAKAYALIITELKALINLDIAQSPHRGEFGSRPATSFSFHKAP